MASIFGKSELSTPWKERFQDVNKLNEYSKKGLKAELSDVIIKGYDITGAEFNNITFRDVEWNNTSIEGMVITNARFIGNTFNEAFFNEAKLSNVTFEDSEFNGVYFHEAQMSGVKFIHCKFTTLSEADFMYLKDSNIEFEYTTFEAAEMGPPKISFYQSNANLTFRNSTLTKVQLITLIFPSSLTFENSKLEGVALDRSKLTKLVMDNAKGSNGNGFNGGSVVETEVRNSEVQLGLQEGELGKVTFVNSKIISNFGSSTIKELHVINCTAMEHLRFYESQIDTLEISNCPVNELDTSKSIIRNFRIDKTSIVNSEFKKMNVKNFTLTDVSLDQKIDFTGAHVEHLITKNITKLPGLNLILTNTNVKF